MDISKRLIELRKATGLSQYRLAQRSGIPQGSISNYELGKSIPGPDVLAKLCDGLGITMAEFYTEPQSDEETDDDPDIREIARARKDMTPEQRARMMKIIKASFEEFFGDDKKPN